MTGVLHMRQRYQRLRTIAGASLVWLAVAGSAAAVEADEILADQKLETRARAISAGLRCLVCQNQSIDDSNAPLAKDLRVLVRDRLKSGDSDAAVVGYVVDRYGEFVLLKPRLTLQTLLLWGSPLLLLGAAVAMLWRTRRQGHAGAATATVPLTREEQAKLDQIMQEET